jgi:hypothetical protein
LYCGSLDDLDAPCILGFPGPYSVKGSKLLNFRSYRGKVRAIPEPKIHQLVAGAGGADNHYMAQHHRDRKWSFAQVVGAGVYDLADSYKNRRCTYVQLRRVGQKPGCE